MTIFESIENWAKDVWDSLKDIITGSEVTREKTLSASETEGLDEQLEKARGKAEAKAALEKKKRKQMEEAMRQEEEVNVSEKLQKERQKLLKQRFKGSTSLYKMLRHCKENYVTATSQKFKKKFGRLYGIDVLKNGQLAAIVEKENGGKEPMVTGRTVRDLFFNYKNIKSTISSGVVPLNVDEEGKIVPDIMTEQVPNVKVDANGNVITTEADTEEVQKRLAQKDRKINQLRKNYKTAEKAWVMEHEERKKLADHEDIAQERADSIESSMSSDMDSVKEILHNDRIMETAFHDLMSNKNTEERLKDKLYQHRDELQKKMAEIIDEGSEDRAKQDYREMAEWFKQEILPEMFEAEKVRAQPEEEGKEE